MSNLTETIDELLLAAMYFQETDRDCEAHAIVQDAHRALQGDPVSNYTATLLRLLEVEKEVAEAEYQRHKEFVK